MSIVKFRSPSGDILYGSFDPGKPDRATVIDGDIFGNMVLSERVGVFLTGTPEGVGFTRMSPVFLKEGDSVTLSIEQIGELTNPVVRE